VQLKLEQVRVVRRQRALLDGIEFTLERGELLALVGPNGAGKTTLLRAILGLSPPERGRVLLDGVNVQTLSPAERAARVAWLPQHSAAAEELPALEVVIAARFRFRESFAHSAERARLALERVGVAALAERALGSLSGGERQRVALAGLLAQEAPLLLVDEPANHLDPAQQIEVYRLLGELWREGKSIVCVTHDVNLLRHLQNPSQVGVLGMAAGNVAFQCRLDAPALADRLGELFAVRMHALDLAGDRVLLPERRP
jgi:iron complex transport system ATP-binding protein